MVAEHGQNDHALVRLRVSVGPAPEPAPFVVRPSRRVVLAVLADLTAQPQADRAEAPDADAAEDHRWHIVDRDNLNLLMRSIGVRFRGETVDHLTRDRGRLPVVLEFGSLEDFEPDHFLEQIEPARTLLSLRHAIERGTGTEGAINQLRTIFSSGGERAGTSEEPGTAGESPEPKSLGTDAPKTILDAILLGAPVPPAAVPPPAPPFPGSALRAEIRKALEGETDPIRSEERKRWIARIDQALSAQSREILHHPDIQRLESNWRGLRALLDTIPDDVCSVRVHACSKPDLQRRLVDARNSGDSSALRSLVPGGQSIGEPPPWMVVTDLTFGPSAADVELLSTLAHVMNEAGTVLIAQAAPELFGVRYLRELALRRPNGARLSEAIPPAWRRLRDTADARSIALTVSKVLGRMPYGKKGAPAERFCFEEMDPSPAHDSLLWEPGSFALVRSFLTATEIIDPPDGSHHGRTKMSGLPFYCFEDGGEVVVQPCAEALMSEELFLSLQELGFIPVTAVKDTDEVLFGPVRTLSGAAVARQI